MQASLIQTIFTYILIHHSYVNGRKHTEYCKQRCDDRNNFLCGIGEYCNKTCDRNPNAIFQYLTDGNREHILNYHNERRQLVGSGQEVRSGLGGLSVANMHSLSWSREAENIASCIAATCPAKVDRETEFCVYLLDGTSCSTNTMYYGTGRRKRETAADKDTRESEAITDRAVRRAEEGNANSESDSDVKGNANSESDSDVKLTTKKVKTEPVSAVDEGKLTEAMKTWYDEVEQCGCNYDGYKYNQATKNFMQMIWAESKTIGCGFMDYKDAKGLFTCVYCPSGRIPLRSVIARGYLGPNCGQNPSYPNLCDDLEPVVGSAFTITPSKILRQLAIVIVLCILLKLF